MSSSALLIATLIVAALGAAGLALLIEFVPLRHKRRSEWLVIVLGLLGALTLDRLSEGLSHGIPAYLLLGLLPLFLFAVVRWLAGARRFACRRCGVRLTFVRKLPVPMLAGAATVVATSNRMEAMVWVRSHSDLPLARAKALVNHLSAQPGRCVHCSHPISPALLSPCPRCSSLTVTPPANAV